MNQRLQNPRSRLTAQPALNHVKVILNAMDLSIVFTPSVESMRGEDWTQGKLRPSAWMSKKAWSKRRRYDGFVLIVAAPELVMDVADIYRLHRGKDAVEKDFLVVKSVLKVRPFRLRSEEEAKGHIALCMLALLLERTLRTKLASLPPITSASMALEVLGTCHLNLCQHQGAHQRFHTVTHLNPDQTAILRALNPYRLGNDKELA